MAEAEAEAEAEDLKSSQCGFDPHSGHVIDMYNMQVLTH